MIKRYRVFGKEEGRTVFTQILSWLRQDSRLSLGFSYADSSGGNATDHVVERYDYIVYTDPIAQGETSPVICLYVVFHDTGAEAACLFSVVVDQSDNFHPETIESFLGFLDQFEFVAHRSSFRSRPLGPVYFRDYIDEPLDDSDMATAVAHPSSLRLDKAA